MILIPEKQPSMHATGAFATVERGIQCLDDIEEIEHIGLLTGKAISMDIMTVAKDALVSRFFMGWTVTEDAIRSRETEEAIMIALIFEHDDDDDDTLLLILY